MLDWYAAYAALLTWCSRQPNPPQDTAKLLLILCGLPLLFNQQNK